MNNRKRVSAKVGMKITVQGRIESSYFNFQIELTDGTTSCVILRSSFEKNSFTLNCRPRGARLSSDVRQSNQFSQGPISVVIECAKTGFEVTVPGRNGPVTAKLPYKCDIALGKEVVISNTSGFTCESITVHDPAEEEAKEQVKREFLKYKDPAEPMILVDGTERLCQDLGVDPSDIVTLVIAWKCGCREMCEWTEEEFVQGLRAMAVTSVRELRPKLNDLRREVLRGGSPQLPESGPGSYYDFYMFCHKYAAGKRAHVLPQDQAIQMWRILLTDWVPSALLGSWIRFLEGNVKEYRNIQKDTWDGIRRFFIAAQKGTFGKDYETYDDSGAWPTSIDDFVAFLKNPPAPKPAE